MAKGGARVAFITGSSSGIGRETALAFAKAGYSVVVTYHSSKRDGEATLEGCLKLGAEGSTLLKLDVTDDRSIEAAVASIGKRYGRIDVLVNNAGVLVWKPLSKQTPAEVEWQVRTNLEGPIKVSMAALPLVKEAVINIASEVGTVGYGGASVYSTTKWGVRGLTKSLAQEYPDLLVVAVNPGLTATKMTGFDGIPASKVADMVLAVVERRHRVESGGDVNVWEVLD